MPEIRDHRQGDWFWINNAIIEDYGKVLGVQGIALYALLAMHANKQETAWPSLRTIAKQLAVGLSTVQTKLDQLVSLGLIARQHRRSEAGDYTSNVYVLLTVTKVARGGVPDSGTPVPGDNIPVPDSGTQVYLTAVHGVPGDNTKQDLSNKTQIEQPSLPTGEGASRAVQAQEMPVIKARKASKRCPGDYTPSLSVLTWLQEKFPHIDVDAALEAMKDCEFTKAHSDWDATFRNWIREEDRRASRYRSTPAIPSTHDHSPAALAWAQETDHD